jgi:hypothetical protein
MEVAARCRYRVYVNSDTKGVMVMPDPLAVAQIEQKQIIATLEQSYRLRDVNAQVTVRALRRLQRLRAQLERAQAGYSRAMAWTITRHVEAQLAAEVVRWWIETSIWYLAVLMRRLRGYVSTRSCTATWAGDSFVSSVGWALAG